MFLPFDLFAIFLILLAVVVMTVYRDRTKFDKVWVGLWSSPILLGIAILIRDYDLISSIVGWSLVVTSFVMFWAFLVGLFFARDKC